jgi:hypothetical protein
MDRSEQQWVNLGADTRHRPRDTLASDTRHWPRDTLASSPAAWRLQSEMDSTMESNDHADDTKADAEFFACLDALLHERQGNTEVGDDGLQHFIDGDDECEVQAADEDIPGFAPYLPSDIPAHQNLADAGPTNAGPTTAPTADALNNTYVRVVHTNGVHHLAMVTCSCMGEHRIPLDLVASRLVPTSFTKIRTLFTVHVLNQFRLCNLELKASAYQFYQLIRRVTLPTRPAEVVNLYHELRRLSRLWRWMKKLKWAGYGHNQKDPLNPEPGSLANFCPACPQPGINIPENWQEDVNWCVTTINHCISINNEYGIQICL